MSKAKTKLPLHDKKIWIVSAIVGIATFAALVGIRKLHHKQSEGRQQTRRRLVQITPPALENLRFESSSQTVSAGGSLDLKVTGGKPPYQFKILSGLGNISQNQFTAPSRPGATTIRVTDQEGFASNTTVIYH